MRLTVLILSLVTSVLVTPGCSDPEPEVCEPVLSVVATPPTITSGDLMMVQVDAIDFTLIERGSEPDEEFDENCAGHYNVYLGSTDSSPVYQGFEEEVTFPVEGDPGDYELVFRLHDLDDVQLVPEIRQAIDITIQ